MDKNGGGATAWSVVRALLVICGSMLVVGLITMIIGRRIGMFGTMDRVPFIYNILRFRTFYLYHGDWTYACSWNECCKKVPQQEKKQDSSESQEEIQP